MTEIWQFEEDPRWPKIQDGCQNFQIDSVGALVTPSKLRYQVWYRYDPFKLR